VTALSEINSDGICTRFSTIIIIIISFVLPPYVSAQSRTTKQRYFMFNIFVVQIFRLQILFGKKIWGVDAV